MFKNHLKIAWRNLWKNRLFSVINIISLAVGLSASFVIGLMVYYDFTFDKFHPDGDRIYRITSEFITPDGNFYNSGVAVPLGRTLKEGTAGIEIASAFFTSNPLKVENENTGDAYKNPDNVIYADENYFHLFDYQWLAGSAQAILSGPNELVLTENKAKKYFPSLSPQQVLGKTLIYNDSIAVNVTGVVSSFQQRSDLVFEEFISLKTAGQSDIKQMVSDDQWDNTNSASQLFVKISEGRENVRQLLDALAKEHEDEPMSGEYQQQRKFHLQPLHDLHFNPNYHTFDYSRGPASKSILLGLALIAIFLLLLGCINFINLNTAQAGKRAKEIGIRKTLGGSKKQLVLQFLSEAFLLTFAAAVISLIFSARLLTIFSDFTPNGLTFELFSSPIVIAFIIVLLFTVTFLSGFYPALVLSHFKPAAVIKNQVLTGNNKSPLRKYLTVFQFVIAQIFIIATLLVGKQINFLMNKDMGFKTEAIAYLRTPWHDGSMDKRLRFVDEIKKLPQIQHISLGGNPPASFSTSSSGTFYFDGQKEIYTPLQLLYGDENYLDLYGIKLLAGRNRLNDTIREYVINETYMRLLGFKTPMEAVGKSLKNSNIQSPIVGVMEDFNQRSLKTTIEPMAVIGDWYRDNGSMLKTIHFSLRPQNTENWADAIAQTEKIWKNIYPETDFELNFMDETVQKFYGQEKKMSVLLNWATGLSVLISCLGLLGLVVYTTERRTKEIGVRKVLGASLMQLNVLLCSEFLVLVGVAFLISAPIAWWGLNNWLQGFAYKTNLSWWVFALSGLAMLTVALIIMSIRTVSAAQSDPVKSLRTE